jgi:hypothetical protein
MQCQSCKINIRDATHCSECGWPNGQVIPEPAPEEFSPEPGKSSDASSDEAFQDGSELSVDSEDETTGSNEDEPEPELGDEFDVGFNNKDSKVRDQIGYLINLFQGPQAQTENPKQSLYKDTYELPTVYTLLPEFILKERSSYISTLEQEHMLVIGCAEPEIAFSAGHVLIDDLGITESQQRRGYDIREKFEEGADMSVQSFLPEKKNGNKRSAVIVNAFSNSGQAFVNSLLADFTVAHRLRHNAVYLLFVVNPAYIDERVNDRTRGSRFPNWKISYLRYLLRLGFPEKYLDYEQQILKQQEEKKWDEDERKLCHEVKSYLDTGKLLDEIQERKIRKLSRESPKTIFKDEQYIERTIIYVATYFPDVTPSEFCELVEALLGDREVLATIPKFTRGDDQTIAWSQEPSVRPVVEIWRDNKDQFMWKRLRETISARDMGIAIDFADYSIRNSLREYLSSEWKFYLKDQFKILQSKGFLFHPSNRVTDNIVRLTADIANAYPDEYKDWLVGIIRRLRDHSLSDANCHEEPESTLFQFLDKVPFNKVWWGYSRISELIRHLMKTDQTGKLVNRCLSVLMRQGCYDAVLSLTKRLRFSTDFDGLYWLKQLFDRGDSNIKVQAFNYLYNYVREVDANIYETLNKLEPWLTTTDRELQGYPQSARFALRLLIKYCLETIYRFNQEQRDTGLIEYPLFAFADDETAANSLDQLIKWLIHPAIGQTLRDLESDSGMRNALNSPGLEKTPERLLGALMAEWAFILPDPAQAVIADSSAEISELYKVRQFEQSDGSASHIGAADLMGLLFKQIASNTNEVQRKNLIAYWEALKRDLLRLMSNPQCSIEQRNRLTRKWNRIFYLIQELKKLNLKANAF